MAEVALLESIKPEGHEAFRGAGLDLVEFGVPASADGLREDVGDARIVGVRSGGIPDGFIPSVPHLEQIGFYCAGVKVDREAADEHGIALFNATDENTRSVAEFVQSTVLSRARNLMNHNAEMQSGTWSKTDNGAQELLGKTAAIKGWGKIGSQAGVLLKNLGMEVIYEDPYTTMPSFGAERVGTFQELLERADYLSLHVPGIPATENLIDAAALEAMQSTAYIINASRGSAIVDQDLIDAVNSGVIAGAHIDVFREEYEKGLKKGDKFDHPFVGVEGITLSPHIAGSTPEAQVAVARSVSAKLVNYLQTGTTTGSVNLPKLALAPVGEGRTRLLNIHDNHPGVLGDLTALLGSLGLNVGKTQQDVNEAVGYVAFDVEGEIPDEAVATIALQEFTRRTRTIKPSS